MSAAVRGGLEEEGGLRKNEVQGGFEEDRGSAGMKFSRNEVQYEQPVHSHMGKHVQVQYAQPSYGGKGRLPKGVSHSGRDAPPAASSSCPLRAAVEQTRHIYDSQNQNLVLALS